MMPNPMKVLRGLGLEPDLLRHRLRARSHLNREWDSGQVSNDMPMPEERFGAPYLCLHRAELHRALASLVPASQIQLDKRLVGLEPSGDGLTLAFADGTRVQADAVIGADGVHSLVRELLWVPIGQSTGGASPIEPSFQRRCSTGWTSDRRERSGGAPTDTSSCTTHRAATTSCTLSPVCLSRWTG